MWRLAWALVAGVLGALVVMGPVAADGGPMGLDRYEPGRAYRGRLPGTRSGSVAFAADEDGTLWLAVSLRGAAPSALHEVFLVCGPTVGESCGYTDVGLLATDERGDADSAEMLVGLATLGGPPFGAGERRDHVTVVDWATNTAYVSSPLAYAVP